MNDPTTTPQLLAALPTGRETVPISRARRHLADALVEGATCPVCGQHAQLYRRTLHKTMADQLVRVYRRHGTDRFHAPTALGTHGGDFAKLAHWGLIREAGERRADGGRAGWWRITDDGVGFVRGEVRVPKYVLLYDGRRIGYDGDHVAITSILRTFDLREIQATHVPGQTELGDAGEAAA